MNGIVANQIRHFRRLKGLTLAQMSAACGLSTSKLSKLETGQARLTVETALQLAATLQVPFAALLASPAAPATAMRSITRAGTGERHPAKGMVFEVLCNEFRVKRSVFWRVEISGATIDETGGFRSHPGEEFLQVLAGRMLLHSRHYEPLLLAPGDSVLFDASAPHAYAAEGGPAVVLMANVVPDEPVEAAR